MSWWWRMIISSPRISPRLSAVAPRHADRPVLDKPFSYAAVAALLDRLAPGRRAEDAPPE